MDIVTTTKWIMDMVTTTKAVEDRVTTTHNGSPIPDQRCLSPCVSVGSPIKSLPISHQSLLLNELEFRK
ncbi:hypothetical protein HanHA300_Chr16g0622481 [Helianthus annuus]|nr:hypothetical protein HanHA300_Chr16g0622481 [Helianthus annuus]KAJ0461538.1 hypothetical protein HanHA89_Chr16g0673371 [Helianthus annuus]KAJ0641965.1 hypothetical protein HanLR1_Chr16g0633031 [Helianthus annuus]